MHRLLRVHFLIWALALSAVEHRASTGGGASPWQLWYEQPAAAWTEALPVGNGRLGAMVFGQPGSERLQLNEDTLWTGRPHEYQHEGAVAHLPELRRLLAEGKQREAEELATREFMSVPLRQMAYQPMADLALTFAGHESATAYRRALDLDAAIASVRYSVDGVTYTRETFSSFPAQALVERVSADRAGSVNFTAALSSPHQEFRVRALGAHELELTGAVKDGAMRFCVRLRANVEGGRVRADGDSLVIEGADAVTLVLTAATNFVTFQDVSADPTVRAAVAMTHAGSRDYASLRDEHLADHRALFRRVSIDLGDSPASQLPTDRRIAAPDKRQDPQLVSLLFQYGRYLLIASSRPGDQPANLQGIWNDRLNPPWGSKYTVNINTEMNYWPAEVANLAECTEPLFSMLDDLVISGRKTAQAHYGARGWVLHHNTDLWRGTAPINASNHGIWPTGGAWLCHHLWEHYRFSGDRDFLARRAYPVMKEAALFFVDFLVRDPNTGWLISGPSNSPENGGLVMGPTMDHQIIRALFAATAEAARILEVDTDLAEQLTTMGGEIAPHQVGRHGQLQEWLEDKDDPGNQHRHVSHLWGLFPGEQITPRTPELFQAAKQSLLFRGDGGTGWSLGWKIAMWARFLDGDHAHMMIMNQLFPVDPQIEKNGPGGTYPNLFDAHPPFQIDGNFAATAGVAEMLLQSHLDGIDLLPALPTAWPRGSVSGLRARGGFEVALAWDAGRLTRATITSRLGRPVEVRTAGRSVRLEGAAGTTWTLGPDLRVNATATKPVPVSAAAPALEPIAPIKAPFPMKQLQRPEFPDRVVDIRDHGAIEGGAVKNTHAFAAAIAACAEAGGGRVLVPAGRWLTGPIHLRSHIELHLTAGAEVIFSDVFADYLPPVLVRGGGIEFYNYSPLIYARDCENVAITGPGKLNGNAAAWWPWAKKETKEIFQLERRGVPVEKRIYGTEAAAIRPSFVVFFNCRNVLMEGFTIGSGPNWTIHPIYCEDIIIRRVHVLTDGPNNDGIDPDSCRNLLVEHCVFDTGDDCMVLKSGYNEDGWRVARPTENVVMRWCFSKRGHGGLVIGSEMSGDVRNVYMHDCEFEGTDRALRIKSRADRGGVVENVFVEDVTVRDMQYEVAILNMDYTADRNATITRKPPVFRNINVRRVTGHGAPVAVRITGMEDSLIQDVHFEDVTIVSKQGVIAKHAQDLVFERTAILPETAPAYDLTNARGVTVRAAMAPAGLSHFMKLSGAGSRDVRIESTDLSQVAQPFVLADGASADSVAIVP